MEKDYIKNAYDVISKDYNAGSFDDFKLSLAKPEGLKKVYDYLSQGYNVGDFDSFQKRLNDRNEGSIQVEQDPYIDDLGDRAMAGANRTLGSFANMIDRGAKNLEDWTDGVIKRGGWAGEAADAFNRRADEYIKESDRYGGKDFIQLFKEGDYTGAFGEIFLSATESLPQSLAIAATKTPGLIGAGIMTGNDKYDQLMDQKPGMNKALAIANASVTGLSETVTEIFGAGMLGKIVRNTLAKGGKAAAGNAIEKIIQDRVVKPIEKHWILGSIGSEGLEEMANAATEYAVDKLTGVERPDDIVETIMKAGVYGAAGGSQYIPVIGGAKYLASNRRKKITSRFNDSQSETSELLGADFDKFDDSLDRLSPEQQHDFIQQVGSVKGLNEEQRNSLLDYVVRKNQYTQYVDYVKSRISEEQQRARDEIDRVSNPDMGAVITVKSNLSENPANIVGGKIVFNEEGLVDIDNSDETFYYLDENGKRQMATPDKFASLIDNVPLSRLYADMMTEVQEKVLSDEESVSEDIGTNNVVDPAVFDIGMDVLLPDGKQGMIQQFDEEGKAIVVTDGGAFSYPVDQLSKMGETSSQEEEIVPVVEDPIQPGFPLKKDGSPDYKAMNPQQRFEYTSAHDSQESAIEDLTLDISSKQKEIEKLNEKLSTSTGGDRLELRDRIRSLSGELTELEGFYSTIGPAEVAPVNDEAAETTQPIVEPTQEMAPVIPTDESGEPIYHQAPIEITLGELMDGTLEPDEVDAFVSAQRQMAEKSLNKAKNYQPKMGTSKAKYLSEKKSAQDKVNGAQAIVDYWNNVENSIKERRVKPGDEIANDIKAVGEPLNGDELAAIMLANGAIKLTRDSYKKETGFSDEDAKKMFGLFSSSGNEGVNLERAGELLMLADQENGTNFFDEEDANAGRNAILSVLSSSRTKGDLINYIKSNREAMAERERQAEYNAYTQWCEEMYRMSSEDYEAYEEQARDIAEKNLLGEEYDDFMSNLANEQDITGNENYQGNEQPGAGGVLEGVGDVLQGEGLVQSGRDGGVEEGSQEIDGSVDSEDGIVQEGPLGRITASEQDTPTSIAKDKNVILDAQDEGQKSFVAPKRNQNDNILDYAQRISDAKNLFDEEQNVNIDPSDAQKEAGNYKKGHVKLNGFDITIEQPAGSVRTGKDADGKEWSVTMNNTYGYIRGTEGVDGDHIDVFLGPDMGSDMVYVADQINLDGSFDEHKVMMGFDSLGNAKSAYLANYEEGWQGLGNITGIPTDDFKKWIDSSKRKTKPFAEYNTAKDKSASDNNRLVTDERYEDLRRRMREKLGGQMNIGVDPEILAIGTEMAVYHIEKGARRFADYAKGMVNDLGDSIRPYLKAFYNGARDLPEMAGLSNGMDPYEEVSRFDVANMDKPVKDMLATIDVIAKEQEVLGLKKQLEEKAKANDNKAEKVTSSLDIDGTIVPESDVRFRSSGEKGDRIKKLRDSEPVEITGNEITLSDDMKLYKRNALEYGKKLRSRYENKDTGVWIELGKSGIKEVLNHDYKDVEQLQSIAAIPSIIENSIYIDSMDNTDPSVNKDVSRYHYYMCGLRIGNTDYTVRAVIAEQPNGERYYDHKLTRIEKGKLLDSLSGITTPGINQETSLVSGIKDTKLLSILQMEERKKAEIVSSIENLSENLNTSINIIQDVNDIGDNDIQQQRKKRGSKGWYDPETREVFLVLPNAESIADAQATVLHEVVGHKGLRGLLGNRFDKMMDTVLRNLPEDTRREIIRESIREYNFDNRKATEEYLASIAEKGVEDPGTWNKIKSSIKEFFRSLGMDLRMTDEDVAYMLWRSKNRLQKGDSLVDIAKKIADDYNMRQDLLFRGAPSGALLSENREGRAIMVDTLRNIHQKWDEGKPIVRKFYERFRESYQDSMLALRRFQEGVEGEVLDFENAYLNQNTIISRSNYEIDHFKNDLIDPINEMMSSFGKSRDAETYLMIRHGLERNERMRAEAVEKKRLRLEREYQEEKIRLDDDLQNMIDSAKFSQKEVERKSKRNDKRLEELEKSNSEAVEKERVKQSLKDYSGLTDISKELLDSDFMDEKGLSAYAEEYEKAHPTGELWDLIQKANKTSINKLFESGYISKEEARRINGMYQYYIPLREWDQTTAGDMYDYFFKDEKDTLNTPIKSAKGRKSRAGDVLANISTMYESAVFIGNKNKMKQRFLNLVRNHPSNKAVISGQWYQNTGTREDPEWIAVLPEGLSEDSERNAEILDEFEKKMADLKKEGKAKTAKEFLELGVPVKTWQADQHAIRVKEAGRDLIIYINGDPRVAQAINGLNNKTVDIRILRYVDGFKRFMMKNYTTRSINFIGRNLIRDMIYVNTMNYVKYGARYEMDFIKNILPCHKAIYRSLRGKAPRNTEERRMMDLYEEFKRNGGQTGFVALRGYDKYKKDLERAIKNSERGKYTVGNLFHTIGSFIEATNTLMEDTSRFSVYATSKQSGKSITQSISDAKEASVNFNRKGSGAMGAAFANSFYFFFNAGTQGTHNFLSASKNNKKRAAIAIGAWGAVGFAMSMLAYSLAMSGDDDDEYNMLPDFVRQNNLVLPILGTSKYILLPLPIELRTIFGAGDMLAQYMRGEYKGRSFSEDLVGKLLDILPHNFVGEGTDNVVQNMLPDASRPFVDAYWFNQNYFGKRVTGRNEYNEHKPEFHKVVSGTSKAITKASEKLNELTGGDYASKGWADGWLTNPSAIEYIFEQMTGGAGKAVTQAYKTVEGLINKDVQLRNIPVVSGLSYDMENAVPRNYINERYNGYMDLIEKENTRDKLYMRGLKEGGDLLDSFKEMRYSKDYMVANIAKMYKSQIEGMYSIAEDMTGEDKKAMFATIRDKKKQMLDEIDAIK